MQSYMFIMSLYIHPENQKLLWNTIQKAPKFRDIPTNKEQWFSNIIRAFYEKAQYLPMTQADIQVINRQTIAYMMDDIQKVTQNASLYVEKKVFPEILVEQRPKVVESYKITDAFTSRQNDYELMTKPLVPPPANFEEQINDEAIQNMDELLQHQIRQREYDITLVKEKMPQHSSISSQSMSSTPVKPVDPSVTKTMNWAVNHEIEELRNQMSELTKRMDILYNKVDSVIATSKHPNAL